ncbi:hypothetical protein LCGC14_1595440 [marine sediment metagenome]|uniref:Uncharacterized protein n=1 Tax=marine sediment metagenome TaxID=412755 RepID=A0A0F9ID33_9ZZZZ
MKSGFWKEKNKQGKDETWQTEREREMDKKLLKWFCIGDVGTSSRAIVFVMCGLSHVDILKDDWSPYPHDSSDFGRCYKLLKVFPEWKKRITEMECLGEIWRRIALAWEELEKLYKQEKHEELYARLQQLQPDELETNCNKVSLGNGVTISTPKP